jgi:hypothetical protein
MLGIPDTPSVANRLSWGFALKAAFCLLLLWILARVFLTGPLWQILLALLVASLPPGLLVLHQYTVRHLLRRQRFLVHGFLFRFFSGRTLALIVALVYGWCAAIILLLQLHTASLLDWLLLAAGIPLFIWLRQRLHQRLAGELKPWILHSTVLRWTRVLLAGLLALPALLLQLTLAPATPLEVLDSIELQRNTVAGLQGSVALQHMALLLQTWEGFKLHAFAHPPQTLSWLFLLAVLLEKWMLFYLTGMFLCALALDRSELRRSVGPLSEETDVPPLPAVSLAMVSAIGSFVLLFIMLPFSVYTEFWARAQQPVLVEFDSAMTLQLERIGDAWYRPGTWDSLQELRSGMLDNLELDRERLVREVDGAFDSMEANVDAFLDWYYSLSAEYLRIAKLLTGELDAYLADKLGEYLQRGDSFDRVESVLREILQGQEVLESEYLQRAQALLASNRVQPGDVPVEPLRELSLADVLTPPVHEELLTLQTRLWTTGSGATAAGVMTAMITAKISSRILAKGSFKLAVKALGKVVASKASGAAMGAGAGATAGAAMGSVVPGVGTAIGAVIGGIAGGILAGIGIDKVLIEIEESISREAFRADILAVIDEARAEFLQGLQ